VTLKTACSTFSFAITENCYFMLCNFSHVILLHYCNFAPVNKYKKNKTKTIFFLPDHKLLFAWLTPARRLGSTCFSRKIIKSTHCKSVQVAQFCRKTSDLATQATVQQKIKEKENKEESHIHIG